MNPSSYEKSSLPDGRVLVAGGNSGSADLASVEIYDPVARRWTAVHSMNYARRRHTATLLGDGTVLIAGGVSGLTDLIFAAELYAPGFPLSLIVRCSSRC
jgi:Kelch motif